MLVKMEEVDYPLLYKTANNASLKAQKKYFLALFFYLTLLIFAAIVSFYWSDKEWGAFFSALLFLITLFILIYIKQERPINIWYNGRAVAESVKTRTWRWMMKAEPFDEEVSDEQAQKELLSDLKSILEQNNSLSEELVWTPELGEAITKKMINIRSLPWDERLSIYKNDRIDNQSTWYSMKAIFNKKRGKQWFYVSVLLHTVAVIMLLYRVKEPSSNLPIEVVAASASAVLTWVQAKKHNELNASYTLAAHEIVLIKGESVAVQNESHLSEFIINSEAAFSREHTQWVARKST